MSSTSHALPRGLAGLQYPITQVSLAVTDLDRTMELYWRAFGWSGWDVFVHEPPTHCNTELRGEKVHYTLKGAEVMVGSINFELLEPLDGPSLWKEHIAQRGDGIASIAVMFQTAAEGEAVKREFAERGMPVTMKANIGEHIEYYYLDTQERFGCPIESGSGHATDFVSPAYVYPTADAPATDKPDGLDYAITKITLVVRELDSRVAAYHEAFGWGPWKVYESDGLLHDCRLDGASVDPFDVRWATARVGDLDFELVEPLGGDSPWQRFLDAKGEGISSIATTFATGEESDRALEALASLGVRPTASARVGDDVEWHYLGSEPGFACIIECGEGRTYDSIEPSRVLP